MNNLILNTDSYKASHFLQYPPGTTGVSSYIEPRVGARFPEIVYFGLQMFLQEYLTTPITMEDIDEAEAIFTAHGEPFNRDGWEIILDDYNGFLPLEIRALPEGTVVRPGTPLVQVRNLDPRLPWLTSYMETAILRAVWYPTTVATLSRAVKSVIYAGLVQSSDDPDGQIGFKLHDFGARGVASKEQAGIGGLAHLVNFMGTDTVEALVYGRKFYNEGMAGFSIPAAEHSTMTAWGKDREAEAYRNMLTAFPEGLVAVVSDSYDIYNAVDNIWGEELRQAVRERGGTVVIRPDSGDPKEMVMYLLRSLGDSFGWDYNSKGFRVLNENVRIIQGDGVDYDSIKDIVETMVDDSWSIDNIAFGMGAGLLQKVNRDTLRFAMKASAIEIDGEWHPVFKDPKSDPTKASKPGFQSVIDIGDGIEIESLLEPVYSADEKLRVTYEMKMGMMKPFIQTTTLEAVRARAAL